VRHRALLAEEHIMSNPYRNGERASLDNQAFGVVLISILLLTLGMCADLFEAEAPPPPPLAAAASQQPCACL
jgi:hypothetical protein